MKRVVLLEVPPTLDCELALSRMESIIALETDLPIGVGFISFEAPYSPSPGLQSYASSKCRVLSYRGTEGTGDLLHEDIEEDNVPGAVFHLCPAEHVRERQNTLQEHGYLVEIINLKNLP